MSVLKSLDINLPQSEQKTLVRFLSLYVFFTIIILGFIVLFYYNSKKEHIIQEQQIILNQYASELTIELNELYNKPKKQQIYPTDNRFKSSIYDSDGSLIHSTIKYPKKELDKIMYKSNETILYIKNPTSSYKGATYVLVEIEDDESWKKNTIYTIVIFGIFAFIIMIIIGYFLSKLFLKPMRDALHLLDRFIKDTTHELNTPVSTIVTNIEMIDTKKLDDKKLIKKINRIDIGAKTISNIYEDLTYLVLQNKIISQNQDLNLSNIIQQRIEYFTTLLDIKKLTVTTNLDKDVMIYIDQKKISKLIDNIISNAIKYNKLEGSIDIKLTNKTLSITDSGCGISQENIKSMLKRYTRFNTNIGGFGIGLNIVKLICDEYNLKIKIASIINEKTTVEITL